MKVLDVLGGSPKTIICGKQRITGTKMLFTAGKTKQSIDIIDIIVPRACFSEPTTMFITVDSKAQISKGMEFEIV